MLLLSLSGDSNFAALMFRYLFFIVNGINSLHMLNIQPLWRVRLTCFSQHAMTLLSLLWLLGYPAEYYQRVLACLMCGVTCLFTCLLLGFATLENKKTPLKIKLTKWRILRNIYTHYISTGILWYVVLDEKIVPTLQHQVVANLGFLLWVGVFGSRAQVMYSVHSSVNLITSGLLPLLGVGYVGFNAVLYYVRV